MKHARRWQDFITMIIGIWVFITPWILGFSDMYFAWCPFVTGALLVIFSIWELSNKRIWEEWVNLIIAAWMFISPWVLGFSRSNSGSWVMFLFGAITFAITAWSLANARIFTFTPLQLQENIPKKNVIKGIFILLITILNRVCYIDPVVFYNSNKWNFAITEIIQV